MAKYSGKDTTTNTMATGGLIALSEAKGWKVREGEPHVRGWDVQASGGTDVGKVDDLLVDLDAEKARYLIVKLDDSVAGTKNRQVAVPLGMAQLDEDDDRVRLPGMTAQQLANLPSYQTGQFTRETENVIRHRMGGTAAQATGRDYYDNALFDESRFYGNRRQGSVQEQRIPLSEEEVALGKRSVQAGEVDIRKTVETQHVREQVPVMREEVEVERRPISGDQARAGAADIGEEEIHVPLMEEEVVVEKRPVAKEELVVKKRAVEGTQEVEADVKKERVDIDKRGNVSARFEGDESARGPKRPPPAP